MLDLREGVLGQSVSYSATYAPELLFPVHREAQRVALGLRGDTLPFVGEDCWNAYELSWLNQAGKPVVALGNFRFPAHSPCLIESKSMKLYLNGLNQTRFVDAAEVANTIARDFSKVAGERVKVSVTPLDALTERTQGPCSGVCLDSLELECSVYKPNPDFLACRASSEATEETLFSRLLKSNCPVTGQPDWATIIIRYQGQALDHEGVLKYIVSYREHSEFHEHCVERIYCDLMSRCHPEKLFVQALYTRRGGLDINPWRASDADFCSLTHRPDLRQ